MPLPATPFGPRLRRRFALEAGTAFLNHGSFGAAPRETLAAAERWRRRMEANPDRFMREILPPALRRAAARLAGFVGARAQDVVFVENATSGVNAVLRSLEFRPGDEILATTHTYNAVRQTLRHVCKQTGAKLVEAKIVLPVRNENSLEKAIEQQFTKHTRLLVLDHIASPTGLIFPVRRLARMARARGAKVLIDGAHAPGQLPLDVPSLGADWYTGNCHKWLFAPRGAGFLWARASAQRGLHPLQISHGYGRGLAAEFDWPGTRDFSPWLSVPDGILFLKELNAAKVRSYNHRLAVGAAQRLAAAWGTPLDGPPELHGSMMAVRLPERLQGRDPARLMADWTARHRVIAAVMRIGDALWARVSAQVYNGPADYERLLRAVRP